VTPGPGHRKCTTYLWPGPGGAPLTLPLTEGLGFIRERRQKSLVLDSNGCPHGKRAAFHSCRK